MSSSNWWLGYDKDGKLYAAQAAKLGPAKVAMRGQVSAMLQRERGMFVTHADRLAYSWHVKLVAGPLTEAQMEASRAAWEIQDWKTALRYARPDVRKAYGLPPYRKLR